MARFVDMLNELARSDVDADQLSEDDILEALDDFVLPARRGRLRPSMRAVHGPPADLPGIAWQDGAYHPVNVDEVQRLVAHARANGRRIRVAGAHHSADEAVYSPDPRDLRLVLDGSLRCVDVISSDATAAVIRVGGGCYLGVNPEDPSSNVANSLNGQLDEKGFALPILGGISHQTVAGFLQTSSSGGSLQHGFASAVSAIEIVDGTGAVRWLTLGSETFDAAAVSLGLFGVMTHVVLAVERRYIVTGTETNHEQRDSLLRRVNERYELEEALPDAEYLHLNWFPQKGVRRVTQWIGSRTDDPHPHDPYVSELKSRWMNVIAAAVLAITNGIGTLDPNNPVAARIIGALLRKFVSLDRRETFRDTWFKALPSDDQALVDSLIRIIFTEIWLPLDQLAPALDRLTAILENQRVAGNFAIELYGAKRSQFWLSPSYDRDVVRVDVFWWAYNLGSSRDHFTHFWNALLDLPGARLHWGKVLPAVGQRCGGVVFGPGFLEQQYPRLADWRRLRRESDPDGVFVTPHWRGVFGL